MHFTSTTIVAVVSTLSLRSAAAAVERQNQDRVFCGSYDPTNPTVEDARDAIRGLPQGDRACQNTFRTFNTNDNCDLVASGDDGATIRLCRDGNPNGILNCRNVEDYASEIVDQCSRDEGNGRPRTVAGRYRTSEGWVITVGPRLNGFPVRGPDVKML